MTEKKLATNCLRDTCLLYFEFLAPSRMYDGGAGFSTDQPYLNHMYHPAPCVSLHSNPLIDFILSRVIPCEWSSFRYFGDKTEQPTISGVALDELANPSMLK